MDIRSNNRKIDEVIDVKELKGWPVEPSGDLCVDPCGGYGGPGPGTPE